MYRPHVAPAPRKGVITLVVLALLTLFTIVGITFVLYADSAATQARNVKDSQNNVLPNMEPEECLSLFLDQFIYGVRDDGSGAFSSIRGHELSRNMYGFNYLWSDITFPNSGLTGDLVTQVGNDVAFNGVGRLHYQCTAPVALTDPTTGAQVDDWKLINYMYFTSDGFLRDPERYGSRTGLRRAGQADNRGPYVASANVPYTYPDINNFYLGAIDGSGNLITPSFHREWLFGRLDAYPGNPSNLPVEPNWTNAAGKYMTTRPRPQENPGFPYPVDRYGDVKNLVGYPGGCDSSWMDIGAPVLTTPDGRKYKMLVAPLILELDGRVNLNTAGNIMGTPIGIQPTHFSNMGLGPWEVNLGKVLTATNAVTGQTEWPNLFVPSTLPTMNGRYGPYNPSLGLNPPFPVPVSNVASFPANNLAPSILTPPPYGQINYRGITLTRIQPPSSLPNAQSHLSCFPVYPTAFDNASAAGRKNHALLYNYYAPFAASVDGAGNPQPYNRRFRVSNMDRLLRWNDTGFEALTSELERLLPYNFNDPTGNDLTGSFLRRGLVTTISGDRNQPGISPYIWDATQALYGANYNPKLPATLMLPPTTAGAVPTFPTPSSQVQQPPAGSDFTTDWRSALTASSGQALTRLDLNNPFPGRNPPYLTPYPSTVSALDPPLPSARFDTDTNFSQFQQAQADRQYLARQIYLRLLAATGLTASAINPNTSPSPANPSDADLRPRRWLAQLAVNMVDFIDNDDISTPFNFYTAQDANPTNAAPPPAFDPGLPASNVPSPQYPGMPAQNQPPATATPRYWVFGTELPRVVINEVLAEYTLPAVDQNTNLPPPNSTYFNNFWVELYNPMDITPTTPPPTNVTLVNNNPVSLGMQTVGQLGQSQSNGTIPANQNAYAAYRILIADQNMLPTVQSPPYTPIPENNNVLGLPYNIRALTGDGDFAQGTVQAIAANNTTSVVNPNAPATLAPQSFLTVAPSPYLDQNKSVAVKQANTFPNGQLPAGAQLVSTASMQYQSTIQDPTTTPMTLAPKVDNTILTNGATVMLQRLANPHIPYNPTVMWTNPQTKNVEPNPWYNPYMTIDYITSVPVWNSSTRSYQSVGKKQPYGARLTPRANTNPPNPSGTSSPVINQTSVNNPGSPVQHTLGTGNQPSPVLQSCDWLTHLDRALVSPAELMFVSQCQPHQLTQLFKLSDPDTNGGSSTFQHAPMTTWFDENARLYRAFEFFETRDRLAGFTDGNRTTGKININAIWDFQTFQALCDQQSNNSFQASDVQKIWNQLLLARSPNYQPNNVNGPTYAIGPTNMATAQIAQSAVGTVVPDRPFLGFATGATGSPTTGYGQNPMIHGINDTIFRSIKATDPSNATDQRLFVIPSPLPQSATPTPILSYQLLTKIFNNITTRSNTFAVFLTVGFFEVTDDTVRPVKLGAEINASEGRAIRHRMFAIIDRSVLAKNPYPNTTAVNALAPKQPFRPSADTTGVVPYWTIIN